MHISRAIAAAQGQEAVQIIERGEYTSANGRFVTITPSLQQAIAGTHSYPPDWPIESVTPRYERMQIEVKNETTLSAAKRLSEAGYRPVALNFASAKHPGGSFLSGARVQEESLARSSGLYACLAGNQMYNFHLHQKDLMYSDYTIYSPGVPVFRADDGKLMDTPFSCAFLTCAAVNAKEVLLRDPTRHSQIQEAMAQRIAKVLTIGAIHGHDAIILGAWGCGVFGNNPEVIADLFGKALRGPFQRVFKMIVFAVLDGSEEKRFIGPFQQVFGD